MHGKKKTIRTMTQKLSLVQSQVTFLQDEHKYFLGAQELHGITSTLLKLAFPDKYKGISDATLKKAAERGSFIHETIELLETVFDGDKSLYSGEWSPELENYCRMKKEQGLIHQAQEYLVTDNEHFASAIDLVYTNERGEIVLSDIKTTSQIYHDSVSLQLSIYAYLFEMMNPDLKVSELSCVWLRGEQSKYVTLPRVSNETIENLIKAYLDKTEGYTYQVEIPFELGSLESEYAYLNAEIAALSARQDEVKAQIMKLMQDNNAKTYKTSMASYSYVPASKSSRFDSTAFKMAAPDQYNLYLKEVETKPLIRITFNKEKK